MSRSNNRGLELKLSLSPASGSGMPVEGSPETSPARSCVSTEGSLKDDSSYCSSPETTAASASASMVVVGCPRCLIYIMLSEVDPTCPNCRSSALLHFLHRDECNDLPDNAA